MWLWMPFSSSGGIGPSTTRASPTSSVSMRCSPLSPSTAARSFHKKSHTLTDGSSTLDRSCFWKHSTSRRRKRKTPAKAATLKEESIAARSSPPLSCPQASHPVRSRRLQSAILRGRRRRKPTSPPCWTHREVAAKIARTTWWL